MRGAEASFARSAPWAGKVAVLSFSRIVRDRRVLRQCALLAKLGHDPLVVAYAGADEEIPYHLERWPVPRPTVTHRLSTLVRQLPAHAGVWAARAGFWIEPRHRWALEVLQRYRPRLVLANDWPALVVATAYKAECGDRDKPAVHYDTHEFATLEFDESRWWRAVYKPFVTHLERFAIGEADTVSTVGPKLAEALQQRYDLPVAPAVVRNIPDRIALPEPTPPHWPLRILYHGQVLPDRGLEALIDSLPLWREPHRLVVRGDGNPLYITRLKDRVAATGCEERVVFEAAVRPDEVMPLAARSADVGVHFTPLDTEQRHFSLPNKLFEYIGSGLAVAVSPGADLRRIVEDYGVGFVSRDASVEAIGETINTMNLQNITEFRTAACEAAAILCWESEQAALHAVLASNLECF